MSRADLLPFCGLDFVPFWLPTADFLGLQCALRSGEVRSQCFSELYTDLTFRVVEMYRWKKNYQGSEVIWFSLEIIMYHWNKFFFFQMEWHLYSIVLFQFTDHSKRFITFTREFIGIIQCTTQLKGLHLHLRKNYKTEASTLKIQNIYTYIAIQVSESCSRILHCPVRRLS